jgi:hypothetical protein
LPALRGCLPFCTRSAHDAGLDFHDGRQPLRGIHNAVQRRATSAFGIAARLTLSQALEAAVFEVAPYFLQSDDEDFEAPIEDAESSAAEGRIFALGTGTLAAGFIMRISMEEQFVGVRPASYPDDGPATALAMGEGLEQASADLLARFASLGWRRVKTEDGRELCFLSPDQMVGACVRDVAMSELGDGLLILIQRRSALHAAAAGH